MKEIAVRHVDVFTNAIFEGNPLTVITEGEELTDTQMQAIAAEFGTPETSFILPSTKGYDYRLRIFSTVKEIPFAGHPVLGAAHVFVSEIMKSPKARLMHETGVGVLPIEVTGNQPPHKLIMNQGKPKILGKLNKQQIRSVCDALTLDQKDLSESSPQIISTGLPQLFIQVERLDNLIHLSPDFNKVRKIEKEFELTGVGVFALQTVKSDSSAHLRFFVPSIGINEDAAAGSAAGGLGAYIAINRLISKEKLLDFSVEQGFEMGRPSKLYVEVDLKDNSPETVRVGGYSVTVSRGVINLP